MKNIKYVLLACIFMACNVQHSDNEKWKQEGYSLVTLVTAKNPSPCDVLFRTETGELIDIVNYQDFTKGLKENYWVKFRRLRRANRCHKAQVVEAEDMK